MRDQAIRLRELAQENLLKSASVGSSVLRTISVTSGKGGVGKTNIVVNLAITLAKMGKRVAILDADLGLANVDVLMGIVPKYSLYEVLRGEKSLEEIIVTGPYNLKIIPGGSGIHELAQLDYYQREKIIQSLRMFEKDTDILIIDTGAGISRNVLGFITAADEVIVVMTPEPTSMTDAYSVIKILSKFNLQSEVQLIVNRTSSIAEAQQTANKIEAVANKFLEIKVRQLGFIFDDHLVGKAVKKQQPFVVLYPNCRASINVNEIALNLLGGKKKPAKGVNHFVQRIIRLFS
ncbi:MinD/ParA family protein [Calderihabitans maritimus]|uniref:Cobyrinic acid ac-diamide synthase n=1 Tax=Calderihabitans maritimus TaxID=1246530 RepID=A0A1Z5HTR9_9FIRM|nr:MinD/ParA family protein [Calderihabitans maritimus]GAW92936.1 Cobyrinic acid ac-diamide synthase [Calderihabitans maritimus]